MAEKEKEITEDVIDVDAKIADAVAPAVAAALKADRDEQEEIRLAAEAEAKANKEALDDAVAEAAAVAEATRRADLNVPEDYEGTADEFVAELAAKAGKATRPAVPSTGAPEGDDADNTRIEVGSEFDRLSTFDLALRHETMKTFGGVVPGRT